MTERPLVVHVLHRFDTGGLENGVVNLINHMQRAAFRHVVVALTEVTEFRNRLRDSNVPCIALHKPPGQGARIYPRFWRLMRELRPAIVHTRNLAALEMQPVAWAAGVPVRIHGEHGRDLADLDGSNRHYQRVRRLYAPFVHRYVALSQDLQSYLVQRVGVKRDRIAQIYNGVDLRRFERVDVVRTAPPNCPFTDPSLFVVGTVGRMQTVKAQPVLAQAFVRALQMQPQLAHRLRLVMVGDGPLRSKAQAVLDAGGVGHLSWLPGERADVPDVMRGLDCFVLPSLAEGISNTILEAMASRLPVLATHVGGNAELVADGVTGRLVPAGEVEALACGLLDMAASPSVAAGMGRAGRERVERHFSLQAMVGAYQALYDGLLAQGSASRQQH